MNLVYLISKQKAIDFFLSLLFYTDIKLYLRRQDPFALYGLSFNPDAPLFEQNVLIMGNEKDLDYNIYYMNEVPQIC